MKRKVLISALLVVAIIVYTLVAGCTTQVINNINTQEAFALIQENEGNPDFVIIDVRTPEEFISGHLENALNLNFNADAFRDELRGLDIDKTYLIYCRSGNRSARAATVMEELGFREVYDMGGITDWIAEGFPIVQ